MNSSMINKIAKARKYAEEPERIQFTSFEATFVGKRCPHDQLHDGEWTCTCRFFHDWGDCSHTMAMQRILGVTSRRPTATVFPRAGYCHWYTEKRAV